MVIRDGEAGGLTEKHGVLRVMPESDHLLVSTLLILRTTPQDGRLRPFVPPSFALRASRSVHAHRPIFTSGSYGSPFGFYCRCKRDVTPPHGHVRP